PTALFGEMNGGTTQTDTDTDTDGTGAGGVATAARTAPSFIAVLGVLLLPFVLISFNTVLDTLITAGVLEEDATWAQYLLLLGNTSVALLITVIVAAVVLGLRRGRSLE
ncbi:UNVERIFIED_CONTAM: GntP family permease, partial [Bacillus amyloliquefaciens DSM 7 = ATCC 23350]